MKDFDWQKFASTIWVDVTDAMIRNGATKEMLIRMLDQIEGEITSQK